MKCTFTAILLVFFSMKAMALGTEERKKLFQESIATLKSSGIEKKVPQFGESFPDAHILGKTISERVKPGPVLLIVYRGGWCPYCIKQLKEVEENITILRKRGVSVIALAIETEAEVRKTKNKNQLSFELVSDKDGALLRKLGFLFQVDAQVAAEYKKLGIDLVENQGNTRNELPIPATYLIGKDMKVKYAVIDADYTKRPKIQDIIKTVENL